MVGWRRADKRGDAGGLGPAVDVGCRSAQRDPHQVMDGAEGGCIAFGSGVDQDDFPGRGTGLAEVVRLRDLVKQKGAHLGK